MFKRVNMFTAGLAAAGAVAGYGVYSYVQHNKKQKIKEIVDEMMQELSKADVLIRDQVGVREKLQALLEGGAEYLQCISDFDGTLTRGTSGGKKAQTSFGVVAQSSLLPEDVKKRELEMREKFLPIERASDKTYEEKSPYMEEWWKEIFLTMKEGGLKKSMISKMVKDGTCVLREGCAYVLRKFYDEKVPVLVFSAGVGDVVKEVIDQQATSYSNITYVSNFIDWDGQGNMDSVLGSDMLHSYNKGEFAASLNYGNTSTVKDRGNVILLGDNEGDACVLKALENVKTCLKIGFLNENVNELRKTFEKVYDIVILDSESMALVGVLLMKLLDKH